MVDVTSSETALEVGSMVTDGTNEGRTDCDGCSEEDDGEDEGEAVGRRWGNFARGNSSDFRRSR